MLYLTFNGPTKLSSFRAQLLDPEVSSTLPVALGPPAPDGLPADMGDFQTVTQQIAALKQTANLAGELDLTDNLTDDPDCLAELEFTYSVFRFRYTWGTVYEITFTNHADAHDRDVCIDLLPLGAVYIDTVETNTMGIGHNGVVREITHRNVTSCV